MVRRARSADVMSHWRSGDGRQDPAVDWGHAPRERDPHPLAGDGPLRAHHRPGPVVARATVAGTAVPVHRHARTRRAGPPENTRPPRPRPFGPQTEQSSLPLTDQERWFMRQAAPAAAAVARGPATRYKLACMSVPAARA